MTFVNEIRGYEARALNLVADRFRSLSEAYDKRRRFNEIVRELKALSPRELEDVGLAPGDIHPVAHDAVYRL